MTTTAIYRLCLVALLVVLPGRCAPRSKDGSHRSRLPETVYLQKQEGDYNIQFHLKDFQVIALLGDDTLGALGDYDYNYDYADFTLKPSTQKPSTAAVPSSPPQPSTSPASVSPSPTSEPTAEVTSPLPPSKETGKEPEKPEANKLASPAPVNVTETVVEIVESSTARQTEKLEETNSPGKIKVQIIETPVGIVPGETQHQEGSVGHSEILPMRRCAQGFTRDKKGRCRRVRKPGGAAHQLPYGFGRLAGHLASRLRYSSSEESLPSSESAED